MIVVSTVWCLYLKSLALVLTLYDGHFSVPNTTLLTIGLHVQVPLLQSPKTESCEIPSYSDRKLQLLEGSTPLKHVGNLVVSIVKTKKVEIFTCSQCLGQRRVEFSKFQKELFLLNFSM
ncbi:hypothetical protein Patl1_26143 [Pistacia atlantica]|uniref:Uncharacterized protein n=1 Tax=Pistacia atlantica TaxID=434234 RepID=A0ACC1B0C9_9ROSI|nr:hypothetical protein Patl1_26143 [Pistacia atlantica]